MRFMRWRDTRVLFVAGTLHSVALEVFCGDLMPPLIVHLGAAVVSCFMYSVMSGCPGCDGSSARPRRGEGVRRCRAGQCAGEWRRYSYQSANVGVCRTSTACCLREIVETAGIDPFFRSRAAVRVDLTTLNVFITPCRYDTLVFIDQGILVGLIFADRKFRVQLNSPRYWVYTVFVCRV